MKRALCLLGFWLLGCGGTGPESSSPPDDAGASGPDIGAPSDTASPDAAPADTASEDTASEDTAPDDTASDDAPLPPDDAEGPGDAEEPDAEAPSDGTEDSAADAEADANTEHDADISDADDGADAEGCLDDRTFFAAQAAPVLQAECSSCHRSGGLAGATRYVLGPFDAAEDVEANRLAVNAFLTSHAEAPDRFWQKPTNTISHGGGRRFDVLDPRVAVLRELATRALEPGRCDAATPEEACAPGRSYPGTTPLRRLTDQQVAHAVSDLFGVALPDGVFPKTAVPHGFRTFSDNNRVSDAGAEQIMVAAEYVSARLDLPALRRACPPPAATADALACDRATLLGLAARAFRRPLTDDEAALVTLPIGRGLPRDAAFRHAVEALLQLPQFLYLDARPGAPVPGGGGPQHLADHAIAARLGLLFLDSLPDAGLLAAAAEGRLHARLDVHAQASRLVADPRVIRAVVAFHDDWLHLGRLEGLARDAERYPDFTPAWIASLRTEARLFATEVLWLGDPRFSTLLGSRSAWVDPVLAGLYGLPAPAGGGWARVTLPEDRVGALTRAGFLAAHAYTATSAPVRRGAWVLEQLLCEELNPPPGVNMELPKEDVATPTIRERLAAHWTDPTCAACHVRLDPAGFAFEHYGALGERREAWENGLPVDASGSLADPAVDFDGASELIAALRDSPRARRCYAQRWFEYAIGRPAETEDACALRTLGDRFEASGGDIRKLLVDVTLTDAFLHRHPREVSP